MRNTVDLNKNNRHKGKYTNISSARPIPHSKNVPVPVFYQLSQPQKEEIEKLSACQISDD